MAVPTLACGPYFSTEGFFGSLALLLIAKPIVYLVFVLAFRYRVSTPEPLPLQRAVVIVLLRTITGLVVLVSGAMILAACSHTPHNWAGWTLLSLERGVIWALFGAYGVKLRDRRLWGWIISGMGIDLAFDFAVSAVFDGSWWESGLVGIAAVAFLAPLYVIGRRPALRARFLAGNICKKCGYDLTNNVSGRCPECGTGVGWVPLP